MSIYRLPHGQYGYTGHVINLPQDVMSFAHRLPRLPSDLDIVVVRKEGADQSHRDFRVRRLVVHRALQWLITNNTYYHANHIHIDEDALAQLPHDGNLSNISSIAVETPATSDQQISEDDPYNAHLARSFVPVATRSRSEQETVQQSVQQRQSDHPSAAPTSTVMWPSSGRSPINEFTTEGYFTCAFPTLFPSAPYNYLTLAPQCTAFP